MAASRIATVTRFVGSLCTDAKFTCQGFSRPRSSATLIATLLTLAFAANAVVYSLVRSVALRPLSYAAPDRLVFLWNQRKTVPDLQRTIVTPGDFTEWRSRCRSFTDIAAVELWTDNPSAEMDLASGSSTSRLRGGFVSPEFFNILGVRAQLGRTFSPGDAEASVALLSDTVWRGLFGSRSDIVGATLVVAAGQRDRRPRAVTIIGVLPERIQFTYPQPTEILLPLSDAQMRAAPRNALLYWVVGLLKPD